MKIKKMLFVCSLLLLMVLICGCGKEEEVIPSEEIVITTNNSQEQEVLANLAMILINEKTNHTAIIEKQEEVTSASLLDDLKQEKINIYFDYIGSIHLNALELPEDQMAHSTLLVNLQKKLMEQGVFISEGLGYDGGLILYMTPEQREALDSPANISDLKKHAKKLTIGMDKSFYQRKDGYKAFLAAYEFKFKNVEVLSEEEGFYALRRGNIDVMIGSRTSVYNNMYNLFLFTDDQRFFSPETICYLGMDALLTSYPEIKEALSTMEGLITSGTMSSMIRKVYLENRDMDAFLRDFLRARNLL